MIINSLAVNLIIVDICILRFAFLGYKIMLFGGFFFFLFIYFISFSCFTINSFVVSKCAFIFLNNNEVLRADRQTLKKKPRLVRFFHFITQHVHSCIICLWKCFLVYAHLTLGSSLVAFPPIPIIIRSWFPFIKYSNTGNNKASVYQSFCLSSLKHHRRQQIWVHVLDCIISVFHTQTSQFFPWDLVLVSKIAFDDTTSVEWLVVWSIVQCSPSTVTR